MDNMITFLIYFNFFFFFLSLFLKHLIHHGYSVETLNLWLKYIWRKLT